MIEIIHLKCGIWNIHCSFRNLNIVSLFYLTSWQTSKCLIIYTFSPSKTGIIAIKHPVGQPIFKKLNSRPF